ncbi:MAG: hypothetical protein JRI61_02305 [Deltaproteobacteria bacterium]|nr:hypothetical protein [Deltaproteobacteria bacterium]
MNRTSLDKFKLICGRIREAIPSSFTWSWDEDFDVARIVFNKSEMDPLLLTLEKEFSGQWDFSSIDKAPVFIENFINSIFGIIPGQILFTMGEDSGPILFAVWCPWGNENYISLRIGIYSPDKKNYSRTESKKYLNEWIGL